MIITEGANLADLLKYEAPNLYSREEVTVEAGQNLKLGTVVGRVSATDQIKQFNPTAEDGSQKAIGVLLQNVDASEKTEMAIMAAREVLVAKKYVIWPSEITEEQKKSATENLYDRGIVLRKGA